MADGRGKKRRLVTYPFPLEDGRIATFYLPLELTQSEANRMESFLITLVSGEAERLLIHEETPEPDA